MLGKKVYLLNAITVGTRLLFPIVLLKVSTFENILFNIDYEVLAFKIVEKESTYYKNVNLTEEDFELLKKRLTGSG